MIPIRSTYRSFVAIGSLLFCAAPLSAQDNGGDRTITAATESTNRGSGKIPTEYELGPRPPGFLGVTFHLADEGLKVSRVREGSPAFKAGIRAGDIIRGIDGVSVADIGSFTDSIRSRSAGDTVTLTIDRDAEISVRLSTEDSVARERLAPMYSRLSDSCERYADSISLCGIKVRVETSQTASAETGVRVLDVDESSQPLLRRALATANAFIIQINDQPIYDIRDFVIQLYASAMESKRTRVVFYHQEPGAECRTTYTAYVTVGAIEFLELQAAYSELLAACPAGDEP